MKYLKKSLGLTLVLLIIACVHIPAISAATEINKTCETITAEIAESQTFETLVPQDMAEIESYLFVDANDLTDASLWMDASAATVEMIAVMTAKDDEALSRILEELDSFIADLTDIYRDYSPEELPKLENAVIVTHGLQTVLVLCKDPQAANELLLNKMWIADKQAGQ